MPGRRGHAFDSDTSQPDTDRPASPGRIVAAKPTGEAYFGGIPEDPRRLTREATFRSPSGAIFRRVKLIDGRLPQFVDLPAAGRSGARDHYILALNDPVRPVYRWRGQLRATSTA